MPHNNAGNTILELPRRHWVLYCFRALLASTTPGIRYALRRQGFLKFQPLVRHAFKELSGPELSGFQLTTTELRAIWDALERYAQKNRQEKRLQPHLEKLYEAERRTMSHDAAPDDSYDGSNPGIVVENATRGVVH